MSNLLPGDVLFFEGTGPIDRAIRIAQACRPSIRPWSRFTHAAIVVRPSVMVQAVFPRVEAVPIDGNPTVVHLALTDAQRAAIASAAEGYVSEEYGVADVLNFGCMLVFGRQLTLRDRDSVWCSQLVADALQAGGILTHLDPWQCSPASLARALGVPPA